MGVTICEVGPRDGLQNEDRVLPVVERIELVDRLTACGFPRIEVGSFVSAKRVPQMAKTEEVFARIARSPQVEYVGLALNARGAERAIGSGVDRINCALVVTETFNQANAGRSVAESVAELDQVIEQGRAVGIPTTVILGASFGCPFEGVVDPARVVELAAHFAAAGAAEIELADTIGVGVPTQVRALLGAVRERVGEVPLGCHLHNTRNTGLANAFAAVEAGATLLDASVGGAGGCPFAPAATGNVPTEDLLYLLAGMGLGDGIAMDPLVETAVWLEDRLGHELPGMVKRAGADWVVRA